MAASLLALPYDSAKAHGHKPGQSVASALDPSAKKALKTAQDFEAMFLEQTLDRVFASSGTEGPLGDNGTGGAVYRSMLVKEYAGSIVKSGGVGIASQIYGEMLKLQEAKHAQRA
jgi:Rod binding domain-containing protein